MYAAAYRGGGHDIMKLFRAYDKDGSGSLEFDEMRLVLRKDMKLPAAVLSDAVIERIFALLDTDGGGEVGMDELRDFLVRRRPAARRAAPLSSSRGTTAAGARRRLAPSSSRPKRRRPRKRVRHTRFHRSTHRLRAQRPRLCVSFRRFRELPS